MEADGPTEADGPEAMEADDPHTVLRRQMAPRPWRQMAPIYTTVAEESQVFCSSRVHIATCFACILGHNITFSAVITPYSIGYIALPTVSTFITGTTRKTCNVITLSI